MPTGLSKSVIDVFLSTLNQVPGKHSGSPGRLTSLIDCQVKKYIGPGDPAERVVVMARDGFTSLAGTARDVQDGASVTVPWADPEVLAPLGGQLVSIVDQVPRVYANGTDGWSAYPDARLVTNQLSESVFHTTDRTVQVPDGAVVGDVTGSCWTEVAYTDAGLPITSSWFGIRSSLGTWVVSPVLLYAPGDSNIRCLAKVVSDGSRFWVFWNDHTSAYHVNVTVFGVDGQQLAFATLLQRWQGTAGYWDVTYQAGHVLFAQPDGYSPPTGEVHVELYKLAYASGTITPTSNVDTTVFCIGPVAWLTNDQDGTKAYLATIGPSEGPGALNGWAIDPSTLTQTHWYAGGDVTALPDSITGWVIKDGLNYDVMMAYTLLAPSQAIGPKYDPACRTVQTVSVTFAGVAGLVKTVQGVILVSRAFAIDGNYFAYTYYQSGSGLALSKTSLDVTLTDGDYMLGNAVQPITVAGGDYTTGGVVTGTSDGFIDVRGSAGSVAITGTDTVQAYTVVASDPPNIVGVPIGTQLLKWTFANITPVGTQNLSNLAVTGSSIAGANASFFILASSGGSTYTRNASYAGTAPSPGTFAAVGSVQITSNTVYPIPGLPSIVTNDVAFLYASGSVTITGASGTGNNATFTVLQLMLPGSDPNSVNWVPPALGPCIVCTTTTQTTSPSTGFTAALSPTSVHRWYLPPSLFDASDQGCNLVVDGANTANNGVFLITGAGGSSLFTTGTDAAATTAQVFADPLPTMSIQLPLSKNQYTFYFHSLTVDYTYIGAQVQVSSAIHPVNDGVYKITFVDPTDAGHHTFVAEPLNGSTNQVNEAFSDGAGTVITIQFPVNQQAEFQPIWFLTPLGGTQPQSGCFERGLAYADWRFEGESVYPVNPFPMSLSSPYRSSAGRSVILPYRAKSFTAGETITGPNGTTTSIVVDTLEATIGLKQFTLSDDAGQATEAFQELLLPGPLAGSFTSSGFHEQAVNLAPEAPFLVSQSNDTGTFGVTPGPIVLQVTYEGTDENGEKWYSQPSPALTFTMLSPNNTYVVGGRLPFPLDASGNPMFGTYGITNRSRFSICVYRTATVNGVPTVQRYKVTNDLNPLGMYNGTGPGSGFSFPDSFTWEYRDQSLDTAIIDQEALYTTKGQLPRYQAPPSLQGVTWMQRAWLAGYDGAVWLSGEKQEGDGNWFFPGFRIVLPGDTALAVAAMEQYLVIAGAKRMWYVTAQQFPNDTGSSGNIPTAVPLPFPNGSTGHVATIADGVVYSSTAGGLWIITRALQNLWLSEPVKDDLGTITGLAIDQDQRVLVTQGDFQVHVYDPVPKAWYEWSLPTAAGLVTSWLGAFTYQDNAFVLQQSSAVHNDTRNGVVTAIAPDFTIAGISFAQTRAVKHCWAMQLVGEYLGQHKLNVVMSYPDDYNTSPTSFGPYSPDPAKPYLIEVNPGIEEAGQYQLRVFASFEGVSVPGDSFSLELVSCEVGVDRRQGVLKVPDGQRVSSS